MALPVDVSSLIPGGQTRLSLEGCVRLPDGFSHGKPSATASVCFDGTLTRASGNKRLNKYSLEGTLCADAESLCALCLAEANFSLSTDISETFSESLESNLENNKDNKLDFFDDWPVASKQIDLEEPFAAAIITAIPLRILCHEECKGLCASCGVNLNDMCCNCHLSN